MKRLSREVKTIDKLRTPLVGTESRNDTVRLRGNMTPADLLSFQESITMQENQRLAEDCHTALHRLSRNDL